MRKKSIYPLLKGVRSQRSGETHDEEYDLTFLSPMVRIFKGGWELGGRFYSELQCLPKGLRPDLMIDGQPTVELDYSAMQPRILLHEVGSENVKDPYLALHPDRETGKVLFQVLLNTPSRERAIIAVQNKINLGEIEPGLDTAEEIVARCEEECSELRQRFYTMCWGELQFVDSQIAERVCCTSLIKTKP